MGEVTQLRVAPKQRSGGRRNLKWFVSFDPVLRKYNWRVEYTTGVQVFTGTSDTDAEADREVQALVNKLPK